MPWRTRNVRLEGPRISIDLARNAARYLIPARAIAKCKGKAAEIVEYWAELPPSDELVDNWICLAEKGFVAAERQLIPAVDYDLLLPDEAIASFDSRLAPG